MPGSKPLPVVSLQRSLLILLGVLLLPLGANAQGGGRSSTGTGGIHTIQGYVFFPSGRKAEGTIIVKLQSLQYGELQAIPDSSGTFTFSSLAPGSYTVIVNAGSEYEITSEGVFIDSDLNLSRMGVRVPANPRRYTVMVHLQPTLKPPVGKPGVLNAALAEVPEKARKLYEKGIEQARAEDTAKAAESLKQAVSLYPNFPLALNELGVQYLKLREVDKAIEVLKEACRLNPDTYTSRLNLGVAFLEANHAKEAEEQLRESVKRNSNIPSAHMYLGIALLRLNKFDEAEKELVVATAGNASHLGMANYYLGGIYWKKQDYPRAIEQLEKYLQFTPNAPDAERVRATIKDLRSRGSSSN
ncbi:MAG TPA: tetratricopeptide repeat protein [Pyrinomonadaceae bacterium]|jgi:tetratricopeptide (TPR) repeat protein|nr:tetratricopeptide repeat protein [Pyrinomonadaceae bacterium]